MKNYQVSSLNRSCSSNNCHLSDSLLIIGGKWKNVILFSLANNGVVRFGQLKSTIPDISQKMLTQQLRELERDGLVTRTAYPETPPRVEYTITELGQSIGAIYETIHRWRVENSLTPI